MPPHNRPLPSAVRHEWVHHIESAVDTPEGPSVRTLLSIAENHGEGPREDLLPMLARRCGTKAVQQTWANWTAVTDRDELRLRLEVMASVDDLDASLTDCILFFFRSSDPALYQAAARALGTHLDAHPALQAYLQNFAETHSVDLDAPIPLNGDRSHRRILVAMAAHRAAGHPDVPVLSTSEPEKLVAASALDLSVALNAVHLVLDGASSSEDWTAFAFDLLEGLPEHPAARSGDPQLLRSWGLLLSTLGDRQPARSTQAWWILLRQIVSPSAGDGEQAFSSRLQQLNRLDELVRAAVRLPESLQTALLERLSDLDGDRLQHFLRYRWHLWATRDRRTQPPADADLPPTTGDDTDVLSMLIETEWAATGAASPLGDGSLVGRRHAAFVTLMRAMGERPDWLQRPVEQRALIAFSALDFSRHLALPSAAVEATFDRFDFPDLREDPNPQRDAGAGPGRAGPATFRILLRLSDWEATGTERLIGTSLLHQITDSYVLMMLLPSRRTSELTASLADALEHQLRLHLRTSADFRPEQFLYETTIRAPHPQFYEQLHRLCRDRTYQDSNGRELPVAAIIDHVQTEIDSVYSRSANERMDQTPWPGDPMLSEQLQYVRRTLTAIRTESDLIDGLEQVLELLDPKSKDPTTGSKGLFGLLTAPGTTTPPLVHRTDAWNDPPTYRALRTELQEHVITLRDAIDHLQPDTLEEAHGVRDDALEIEEAFALVESHIVPVIGIVEGTMLSRALDHLRAQLQSWTDALATLHTHWRTLGEAEQEKAEKASRLFDQVLNRDADPPRRHLVSLLARTLAPPASSPWSDGRPSDAWTREEAVLEWALAPAQLERLSDTEYEIWMEVFTRHWQTLLTRAMDAGYESRVRHLTTDAAFEPVWEQAPATPLLDETRTWFLDRYHLPAAREITTALQSHSPLGGIANTTTAFFAHFSRVWLALLLGAVLMLDFGGAWTAMAAEGNVVSVGVTFVVGVVGTLGYLFIDLRQKVRRPPDESVWRARRSRWLRLVAFLGVCLLVTVALTSTLWFLLTGTGEVVEGPGAILHVVVWTGFALFVGIFFGLLAESA